MRRLIALVLFLVPAGAGAQEPPASEQVAITRWRVVHVEREDTGERWTDERRARRVRNDTRAGLCLAGGSLLGAAYTTDAFFGQLAGFDLHLIDDPVASDPWADFRSASLVPVAGPWAQLALIPEDPSDSMIAALVVDGLAQLAGLLVIVLGLALV